MQPKQYYCHYITFISIGRRTDCYALVSSFFSSSSSSFCDWDPCLLSALLVIQSNLALVLATRLSVPAFKFIGLAHIRRIGTTSRCSGLVSLRRFPQKSAFSASLLATPKTHNGQGRLPSGCRSGRERERQRGREGGRERLWISQWLPRRR